MTNDQIRRARNMNYARLKVLLFPLTAAFLAAWAIVGAMVAMQLPSKASAGIEPKTSMTAQQ